jgi:hypothetical protein
MTRPASLSLLVLLALAACDDREGSDSTDTGLDGSGGIDTEADATADAEDDTGPGEADSSGDDELQPPEVSPCNPLADEFDCLLPYPSDFFAIDDASLPSGRRVRIPNEALPQPVRGVGPADFSRIAASDGFSPGTQILALFGTAIDDANLATYDPYDPAAAERSVADVSPTLLFDLDTGVRVPHIAELDARAPRPEAQSLVLRPLVRLTPGHRYAVAVRGLRRVDGQPVEAPRGFAALRDGVASTDARLLAQKPLWEATLRPAIEAQGLDVASLQLAWSFTVGSDENLQHDMLAIRRQALGILATEPVELTVDEVTEAPTDRIARRIKGHLRVPLFLDSGEPGARIHRLDGEPARNGSVSVPFVAIIPASALDAGAGPMRLLQFGHGFFGSTDEIEDGYVPELADRFGFVVVGMNWWGMSSDDLAVLIRDILNDISLSLRFTDRLHQAMVNFMALASAREELARLPAFEIDGRPAFDPEHIYFQGISQGHILGGTYSALSPFIERSVLSVGGADFSAIMFRARPFTGFLGIIASTLPNNLEQQKFALLSQSIFDRIDPWTYTRYLLSNDLDGTPMQRRVLMQMGRGDTEVPNLGTELHARVAGLPVLDPMPWTPSFMSPSPQPVADSALAVYDFGVDPFPAIECTPATDGNGVHDALRGLTASMRQIDAFLRPDGQIRSFCEGVCDPE